MAYSKEWQKIIADQEAEREALRLKGEQAYKEKIEMRERLTQEDMKRKALEPQPTEGEILETAMESDKNICRSGLHFLNVRHGKETGAPMLYIVQKLGGVDRVAFPVRGNQFEAYNAAHKLFHNRVTVINSTRPADIPESLTGAALSV